MSAPTIHPAESVRPGPPPSESLCLPSAYVQRERNETLDEAADDAYWAPWRIEASRRYQRHVYVWAQRLIRQRSLGSVLDVGCGVGAKLRDLIEPVCSDVTGVDQASAIDAAGEHGTGAELVPLNLDNPDRELGRTFDLILCADVLEHLLDPDRAMSLIRSACHERTLVLLSTPDRRRRRGRACMRSEKPVHVREWASGEFRRYATTRGFDVIAARMLPQDDTRVRAHLWGELLWRLHIRERSGLACTTLLCKPSAGAAAQ